MQCNKRAPKRIVYTYMYMAANRKEGEIGRRKIAFAWPICGAAAAASRRSLCARFDMSTD